MRTKCGNCGSVYENGEDDTPIRDFWERVGPGDEMPAGQCPDDKCGALTYLDPPGAEEEPLRTHDVTREAAEKAWNQKAGQ